MSLLDQIGPVMVGPSSSHTAGACRIALLARHVLGSPPRRARFVLHGSFAKTAQGHGTDLALVAGLLDYYPDDERIRDSFARAAAQGLEYEFTTADLGDIHPNSVLMELSAGDGGESVSVLGSSLGAGFVKISQVNGFDVQVSGAYHTILALHTDRPGVIARVASVVADDDGNIATAFSARQRRGGHAMMSVEIDRPLAPYAVSYLSQLPYIHWLRTLPAVMTPDFASAAEGAS
ncbi:MAG: L-serine ammonia-lyase, iron-sulfur-dependent subunit beta [Trueperaceae bacterium]|jgi:L-serine dehydratase|nr:L-serine ammonia-lyase, iron-sulfur-dependent subunit beta [Truepera sp.]HRN18474.1 L-serine ammonia-lyase, iron-sulfur-dependent subunit beta [Trueperaceae bacterium]HRQ10074.1 L-serine ammonia-lyase, iron-sulfur-dependent subunit beta [Trueperaceae bacterium]